jgi:hypothetical protein
MKLPRYSLRTMLIAVAIIAAGLGWLRYESQRGWTAAKLHRLLKAEVDPKWNSKQVEQWVIGKGFSPNYRTVPINAPKDDGIKLNGFMIDSEHGANIGLFRGPGNIQVIFRNDKAGRYYDFSMYAVPSKVSATTTMPPKPYGPASN